MKGADTVGTDPRGYDAGKKINGRKRFIVTDTLGLLITVVVCTASMQDRDGAKPVLLQRPTGPSTTPSAPRPPCLGTIQSMSTSDMPTRGPQLS